LPFLNLNLCSCNCSVYQLKEFMLLSSSCSFPFPNSFGVGAARHLLPFSSSTVTAISLISCPTQSIHLFFRSASFSPSFYIHVHHSSSLMLFLSPHYMSIPAQTIPLNFFHNWCYFHASSYILVPYFIITLLPRFVPYLYYFNPFFENRIL
jgi:hypothetical protein